MKTTVRDIRPSSTRPGGLRQVRRGISLWRTTGSRHTAQRVARAVHRHLDAGALDFPLLMDDIGDSRRLDLPAPPSRVDRGQRLRVGWVTTPPGLGSGGHTTMFRMLAALESAGHECTVFLYDRYDGDVRQHEATIRAGWPWVRARVADARVGVEDLDVCVATSWQTAHVLVRRARTPMRRLYLVQDFEPFFYPLGAEFALAEDSYRFGFRCVAVGHMVADLLRERVGIEPDVLEFGCDTEIYRLRSDHSAREGVVFYTKPQTPRRGFLLGALALRQMHAWRPDVPIHLVGAATPRLPFPTTHHGVCSPAELSSLYNETVAGIALSFTNISLVAEEMLACGTVPVVNDSPYARADVRSNHVRWALPTPSAIAEELLKVVDAPPDPARVSESATDEAWRPAQRTFLAAVEDEAYAA